jgi:hypothetical protein
MIETTDKGAVEVIRILKRDLGFTCDSGVCDVCYMQQLHDAANEWLVKTARAGMTGTRIISEALLVCICRNELADFLASYEGPGCANFKQEKQSVN